jgi:hypothetical protein
MAIDKRISYRFGSRGYQGGRNTGVSRGGGRGAAMGTGGKQKGGTFSQGTPGGSGGPTSGGGGSTPPSKKKTTTVTTGGASPFTHTKTPKGRRTTTGGIKGGDWRDHAMRVMQMKKNMLVNAPKYSHLTGGYDFQKQFDWNPKLSSYAAALWQTPQEITRGIGKSAYDVGYDIGEGTFNLKDSWGNLKQNISTAWDKANRETTGNIEGILAASTMPALQNVDTQTWDKVYGNTLLANGGLANLYRYGGYLG